MIQDIYPHNLDNRFKANKKMKNEDIVFCFKENEILVNEEKISFPKGKELKDTEPIFLFTLDEQDIYLLNNLEYIPKGYEYVNVRTLRKNTRGMVEKQHIIFAVMTALQLSRWYRDNTYCGRCGHRMELATDERKVHCNKCGLRVYPKIVPAVIAGVTCNGKILLTKYAGKEGTKVPYYALIGG